MAIDPWTTPAAIDRGGATVAGAFMAKVYRWMAGGLALTGLFAWWVAQTPAVQQIIFGNPLLFFGLLIAEIAMVWSFSRVARSSSIGIVAAMFLAYSALSGLTFSVYFLRYAHSTLATAFFVTGGTFLAMSAYATITKKDLTSWGQFLMVGLVGVLIALVVNIFIGSSALDFIISCAGVVVFTGLTAYDTQKISQLAEVGDERLALVGALTLYLDFVNLFIMLLRLLGGGRRR